MRAGFEYFLELVGVTGLAVALPLLDLLGKNAALFVAWQTTGMQIVEIVFVIVLGAAVVLALVGVAIGFFVARAREPTHAVTIGVLGGIVVVEAMNHTGVPVGGRVALAIAVAALVVGVTLRRITVFRIWLRYLSIAPVCLAALFVFSSSVTPLVFQGDYHAARVRITSPKRVVMVVMDEFPLVSLLDGSGHIDASLYPNIARLASASTWYRNDTTVAPITTEAVPAILTGRYPTRVNTVPSVAEYPKNIFTLLGKRYELNVHERVTQVCPTSLCPRREIDVQAHQGVSGALRDIASIWRDRLLSSHTDFVPFDGVGAADPHALSSAQDFIDSLTATVRPRLDFVHLLLPHFPWHYVGTGQDYAALPLHTLGLDGLNWASSWTAALARQRHLLQVQAADRVVGRIIARLQQIGAWDQSLFVLTADHGIAFEGGKPMRGVDTTTYEDIMWTPLFVKAPGQLTGVVDDRPAHSIDILPTVADHVGATLPWPVDGSSLKSVVQPELPRKLLDWNHSAIHPRHGLFLGFDGVAGFREVLRRRAAPFSADALRLYRLGRHGSLVGTPAGPLVNSRTTTQSTVHVDQQAWYPKVPVFSQRIPWTDVHGTIDNVGIGTPIAISINGTIAGVYETTARLSSGRYEFWGTLPPFLFRLGPNDVRVYLISGRPGAESLSAVPLD